ncbi:pilus assembly protein [Aeromonas caviae]|uniref:pilus assembly protein n=1 Tax=Aeromonas TaxID=642 RepID=UPI0012687F27
MWLRKANMVVCWSILMLLPTVTRADDTELFIYDFNKAGDFRPKVLFIFDNSGSMANTTTLAKEDYDPEFPYVKLTKDDDGDNDYIYVSNSDGTPPKKLTDNKDSIRFKRNLSACATLNNSLKTVGLLTTTYWNYVVSGNEKNQVGKWNTLKGVKSGSINIVDCLADYSAGNSDNSGFTGSYNSVSGTTKGYPIDTENEIKKNIKTPWQLSPKPDAPTAKDSLTLYSANYLRWYHSPNTISNSRLNVAKQALRELVRSTPGVDFGLAAFNYNTNSSGKDGGKIVRTIVGNDAILASGKTGAQDLIDTTNALVADTNTPLCETLYEAYLYFGGGKVKFGDDDKNRTPKRDPNAESPTGTYKAPYDKCSNNGYIIYMTDGAPNFDTAADSLIKTLTEKESYGGTVGYGSGSDKSYLAALAGHMKNKDVNPSMSGKQTVTTFTVGFGNEAIKGAEGLLKETAKRGGGVYYPATDATQLNEALKATMLAILKMDASMVSPAIASNNFDRTRSLNNVYYAMFEPDSGPRWRGNLKKLVFKDGYVADSRGLPAIKSDGTIIDSAQTFWSSNRDGNKVVEGGAQAMLAAKSNRNLYVINNAQNRLDQLTRANLVTQVDNNEETLKTFMQIPNATTAELDKLINWTKGLDAYGEDGDTVTQNRRYIMGDPLHSRPLVLNYGPQSGNPADTPDLRILFGTNAGFLHMFKDKGDEIDESWAVIPYEFMANQNALRVNAESAEHIYGVDSSPVALIKDANGNGVLKYADDDSVLVFTGLRSGGRAYYAFDISKPDAPELKWFLNNQMTGFDELGLTWSVPEVAFVPGVDDPVLIFAGGYDKNKDALALGTSDSMGRGIYIVNAYTGALEFSATPAAKSATNLQVTEMTDSMPGSVATLDSDGDNKIDRIYVGDTGGNIWRMDLPSATKTDWRVFKFASLGSRETRTADRRFFTQPIVVRTINKQVSAGSHNTYTYQDRPFDAVLIGSGDRNRPSSEAEVRNGYFMLRDYGITANAPVSAPIVVGDLYDVTLDPLSAQTTSDGILATKAGITSAKGWVNWLNETGEKSLGAGVVLEGKLYFTSFLPQVQSFQQCTIQSIGVARQYMVDMHYGTSFRYVVDQEGNQMPERYVDVQNKVADDLVVHAGDDAKIRILGGSAGKEVILKNEDAERCTGSGECAQGAEEADMDMSPKKIYLYEGEAQ